MSRMPPTPPPSPPPQGPRRFEPRAPKPTLRPRRVINGVKLRSREGPDLRSWAAQRWMRLIETTAPGDQIAEGLEYARLGQTRTLEPQPGIVAAKVQGRMPEAYAVAVRLPKFQPEQWEQVIAAMTAQARYAATLLAGELPPNIEELFSPLGLKLFPTEPAELAPSCTCDIFRGIASPPPPAPPAPLQPSSSAAAPAEPALTPAETPAQSPGPVAAAGGWCKHVCCVMMLLAERFGSDPFLIFTLRGMTGEELLERLAQRRAVAGSLPASEAGAASPVYLPHLPGISDMTPRPLEQELEDFWRLGPSLEQLEIPIEPPEVAHPILRRLGPSPFDPATGAKFPLVGLLATCYDVISQAAIAGGAASNGSGQADAEQPASGPD